MSVNVGERNVPETPANQMFYAVDSARSLAVHTIVICANKEIFKEKYSMITQEIINTSIEIYKNAWTANNVLVKTAYDWEIRRGLQKTSVAKCNALLALIDLSKSCTISGVTR